MAIARTHLAKRTRLLVLLLTGLPVLGTSRGVGEEPAVPQATAAELALRLPDAAPIAGGDRRVVVADPGQPLMVARVYLEVGDHYVLLMPDGSLRSVQAAITTPTDRPFEPLEKKALAEQLTRNRFVGFRTKTTRRYLYIYNTSPEFAKATGRILESMYTPLFNYCKGHKLQVRDPEFPLVVIMFRTQDEFAKYREVPEGLIAYYNALSNHVVMFEQSRLAEVAPELAFKQAVSTIAHEGVHQILHNIGVQQRLARWPVWLSEGLAEYFAPTELDHRVRWKGVGYVNDLRLHELSEFYKTRQDTPLDGQLIRRAVECKSLDSLGYATSWALIHYLSQHERDGFHDCLQAVSKLKPLQTVPPGGVFAKHFDPNYQRIEQKLTSHLRTLPYVNPVLNQTHYVVMLKSDKREVFVTSSPPDLKKYLEANATKGQYHVQAFPNRVAAEFFARSWLSAG